MRPHAEVPVGVPGAIPSLDGLRALAVSLVFFSHGGSGSWVPGGLGVTLFFVLSGFLITVLLRREHSQHGRIALRAFYLRRLLRLMPPLLAIVMLSALLATLGVIEGQFSLRGLLSVLFYWGNYHVIATDFGGLPAGLGVIWSLAVEEHYYLLYPPLAVLLLRRRSPRHAAILLGGLCVLVLGWRSLLYLNGASEAYLSMATDTRADAILMGCVCGFLCDPALRPQPLRPRNVGLAFVCLVVLMLTLIIRDEDFRQTLRYSVQGMVLAPLILLAVVHASHPLLRLLQARPLVYLGTVSYTVYLVHQVLLYGVHRQAPGLGEAGSLLLTAVLTLGVAELIRRHLEMPVQQLRRRLRTPAPRSDTGGPLPATAP